MDYNDTLVLVMIVCGVIALGLFLYFGGRGGKHLW